MHKVKIVACAFQNKVRTLLRLGERTPRVTKSPKNSKTMKAIAIKKTTYAIAAKNQVHGTSDVMYYGLSKLRASYLADEMKRLGAKGVKIIKEN